MKRFLVIIVVIILVGGAIWAGWFYWQNLRGIGPAISPPPANIASLIGSALQSQGLLKLPPGFSISIFAQGLGDPRVITRDPLGNLMVSIPAEGRVVVLPDKDGNGVADQVVTIASGLNNPHGLATRCIDSLKLIGCKIYIAESDQVAVYDYDWQNFRAINKKKLVDLPNDGKHFTRTIMFLPYLNQDKLLISVGSDCNACQENDWRRAKILVVDADGKNLKTFASGLRNSVFMTINPIDSKIWATEMGRDYLGDDLPPDEINIIEEGKDYGWPECYGKNTPDKNFDPKAVCANDTPSNIDIPAHSAPLGLAFVPEEGWPREYWYNLLVAYHGSWNRSVPTGYKIVRLKIDERGNYSGAEDFITGWLTPQGALGRPVDIYLQAGGLTYISDDKAGVIYRVAYQGKQ